MTWDKRFYQGPVRALLGDLDVLVGISGGATWDMAGSPQGVSRS
jgi:hypothetical protein